jgi:cell division protein FtsB
MGKMKKKIAVMYVLVITIPMLLGLLGWQTGRYAALEKEIARYGAAQEECIAGSRRLIADIALLSSSERIESYARDRLHLSKKRPEEVLQIQITGERSLEGRDL